MSGKQRMGNGCCVIEMVSIIVAGLALIRTLSDQTGSSDHPCVVRPSMDLPLLRLPLSYLGVTEARLRTRS